jgi:hypothetical protein
MRDRELNRPWSRRFVVVVILACAALCACLAEAGRFLVVSAPKPSDVIIVLAGETDRRPALALDLLAHGYARHVVIDVPTNAKLYEFTQIALAQKYIDDLSQNGLSQTGAISVCPIEGLSTKDESKDAAKCLEREAPRSVLIVTSDFHTRRALSVFRKEVPRYEYSVAGAHNEEQFGVEWWKHRQWAKLFFDEWIRLIWWKAVDQWR